jgi:hypothetical protein
MILKWIFKKWDYGAWTGFDLAEDREVAGSCECGNERSEFYKMRLIS